MASVHDVNFTDAHKALCFYFHCAHCQNVELDAGTCFPTDVICVQVACVSI